MGKKEKKKYNKVIKILERKQEWICWLFKWLILMAFKPIQGYFMP